MAGLITTYGDKTSSNSTSYPDYITGLLTKGYGALDGASSGLLSGLGSYTPTTAPWNKNLSSAFDTAGSLASGNRNYAQQIMQHGGGYTAAQIDPADIKDLMSPYLDRVGSDTMREIGRNYADASSQAGARAASGVAFGGSGSALALERAQLARNEGQQRESAINGILSQGWDQGTNIAAQNAQMQNEASQFTANQGLQAAIGADNAQSNFQNRGMDAMQGLLSTGQIKQSYDQSVNDAPWSAFTKFMSSLPGAPSTTTQNDPQTIDWLALLGSLGSKALGF